MTASISDNHVRYTLTHTKQGAHLSRRGDVLVRRGNQDERLLLLSDWKTDTQWFGDKKAVIARQDWDGVETVVWQEHCNDYMLYCYMTHTLGHRTLAATPTVVEYILSLTKLPEYFHIQKKTTPNL